MDYGLHTVRQVALANAYICHFTVIYLVARISKSSTFSLVLPIVFLSMNTVQFITYVNICVQVYVSVCIGDRGQMLLSNVLIHC